MLSIQKSLNSTVSTHPPVPNWDILLERMWLWPNIKLRIISVCVEPQSGTLKIEIRGLQISRFSVRAHDHNKDGLRYVVHIVPFIHVLEIDKTVVSEEINSSFILKPTLTSKCNYTALMVLQAFETNYLVGILCNDCDQSDVETQIFENYITDNSSQLRINLILFVATIIIVCFVKTKNANYYNDSGYNVLSRFVNYTHKIKSTIFII